MENKSMLKKSEPKILKNICNQDLYFFLLMCLGNVKLKQANKFQRTKKKLINKTQKLKQSPSFTQPVQRGRLARCHGI
jgi:hypothetical protein